jgi:hypothetical protein
MCRRHWSALVKWPLLCLILLSAPLVVASDCLPIREASQHVGETKCVTGKVLRVKAGAKGVHFVDFCEDQMACPFTVVVFSQRLERCRRHPPARRTGHRDSRAGKALRRTSRDHSEPHWAVERRRDADSSVAQEYDVEKQGHYSAGRMRPTKKPAKTYPTPATTGTYGNEADVGEEPPQ